MVDTQKVRDCEGCPPHEPHIGPCPRFASIAPSSLGFSFLETTECKCKIQAGNVDPDYEAMMADLAPTREGND